MATPPMLLSPQMLHSMLTDPRATPEQRAGAVSMLGGGGQGGGGAMPAPAPSGGGLDIAAALGAGSQAAGGMPDDSGSPPPKTGTGDGDIPFAPGFMELVKKAVQDSDKPLSHEDKGLALAQAGFGMAASGAHTFGQALGAGAVSGVEGLQKLQAQRAQDRMRALALANTAMGTQALMGQRAANTAATNQKTDLIGNSILTREQLKPTVDAMIAKGDYTGLSRFGAGPAGLKNKALALQMIGEQDPDLANNALTFEQSQAEHQGYGKGMGARAAGPVTYNPGEGAVINSAPAPQPLATPGMPQRAPAMAPAPVAAPPVAAPQAAPPAAAPPAVAPAPKADPYAIIPAPQPLPQPTTTGMKSEVDKRAAALGDLSAKIDTAADAAKQTNFVYGNMNAARDHFVTGKGSALWNDANAYLLQAANGFNATFGDGTIDTKNLENKVGNYQDFQKNAVNLTGAATKAVSPRASTQEMTFLGKGVPSADMADKGYGLVVNQLQAVNDFALAQQKAKSLYLDNPKNTSKTLNDFDTWFNDTVDPAVFMLHRMAPDDAAEAINYVKKNNPEMAKKLIKQLSTAKTLGLFVEN